MALHATLHETSHRQLPLPAQLGVTTDPSPALLSLSLVSGCSLFTLTRSATSRPHLNQERMKRKKRAGAASCALLPHRRPLPIIQYDIVYIYAGPPFPPFAEPEQLYCLLSSCLCGPRHRLRGSPRFCLVTALVRLFGWVSLPFHAHVFCRKPSLTAC